MASNKEEIAFLVPQFEGDLPTLEEAAQPAGPFAYVNHDTKRIYAAEDSLAWLAGLVGWESRGEKWLRTEGGETAEYKVVSLSELDLEKEKGAISFLKSHEGAQCKTFVAGQCYPARNAKTGARVGSIKLDEDVKACASAPSGSCDYEVGVVQCELYVSNDCSGPVWMNVVYCMKCG